MNDLRAVLLEIANAPPRLRDDHELYQTRDRAVPGRAGSSARMAARRPGVVRGRAAERGTRMGQLLQLVKELPTDATPAPAQLARDTSGSRVASKSNTQCFRFLDRRSHGTACQPSQRHSTIPAETVAQLVSDDSRFFGEQVTVQKVDRRGSGPRNWGIVKPGATGAAAARRPGARGTQAGSLLPAGQCLVAPCLRGA